MTERARFQAGHRELCFVSGALQAQAINQPCPRAHWEEARPAGLSSSRRCASDQGQPGGGGGHPPHPLLCCSIRVFSSGGCHPGWAQNEDGPACGEQTPHTGRREGRPRVGAPGRCPGSSCWDWRRERHSAVRAESQAGKGPRARSPPTPLSPGLRVKKHVPPPGA